jgi:hypothetical protein
MQWQRGGSHAALAALSVRAVESDNLMAKEPLGVTGPELIAALEMLCKLLKQDIVRIPDLGWNVAAGSLNPSPTIAVVIQFDPDTMKPTSTHISSEKRAAVAWNRAHEIKM